MFVLSFLLIFSAVTIAACRSPFFLCPLRCLFPCSVFVRVLPLFQFRLLQLLLWAEAVGVTTLLLTTVHGARMEAGGAQPEKGLQVGFRVKKFVNTTCRSSCRSCTSEQAVGEKAR